MINFENNGGNGVLMGLNFIFAISASFCAKGPHVLKVHGALSPIDFHESALVPYQSIRDQRDQASR